MSSTSVDEMSIISKYLWFTVPGLIAYYFGSTVYVLEILSVFVIGKTNSQKDYAGGILFTISIGVIVSSTIRLLYTHETFTWAMVWKLLMLVWWAKGSDLSLEPNDLALTFCSCWFYLKIFIASFKSESYALKIIPISLISAFVKYSLFNGEIESNENLMEDSIEPEMISESNENVWEDSIEAGMLGVLSVLLLQVIQNIIFGKELLPKDETQTLKTMLIVILFIFGYVQYRATKSEAVQECYIYCFMFIEMSLLFFAVFILHPLFTVYILHPICMLLIMPLITVFIGLLFYDSTPNLSKDVTEYIFGPTCFSAAFGILIWTFKDYVKTEL